jgi:hypothetical protein
MKIPSQAPSAPAGIRIENFLNKNLEYYLYKNLLGT